MRSIQQNIPGTHFPGFRASVSQTPAHNTRTKHCQQESNSQAMDVCLQPSNQFTEDGLLSPTLQSIHRRRTFVSNPLINFTDDGLSFPTLQSIRRGRTFVSNPLINSPTTDFSLQPSNQFTDDGPLSPTLQSTNSVTEGFSPELFSLFDLGELSRQVYC